MKHPSFAHPLTIAALSAVIFAAPFARAQTPGTDTAGNAVVYNTDAIAKEFQELERKMIALQNQLKDTDPERATKLQTAIEQSRSAGILKTLRTVAELLGKKEIKLAIKEQEAVVAQMEKLLALLLQGSRQLSPEDLKRFEEMAKQLQQVLQEEQRLQQLTDQLARDVNERNALENAVKKLEDLIKRQQEQKAATEKLEAPSKQIRDLSEARAKLRELIAKQGELKKATDRAAGEQQTPDLSAAEKKQGELQAEAKKAKDEIKALADQLAKTAAAEADPNKKQELEAAAKAAQAASENTDESSKQMGDAKKELGDGKPQDASNAQHGALAKLAEAEKQLSEAIAKAEGGKENSFAKRGDEQKQLAHETDQLAQDVKNAQQQNQGGQQGQQGQQSLQQAGQQMNEAAQKLDQAQKPQALQAQERALEELKKAKQALEERKKELQQQIAKADTEKMKMEQEANRKATEQLAQQMKGQQGQQPAPGQQHVQNAGQNMQKAEQNLGEHDPQGANEDQKQAVEDLKQAQQQLQEAINKAKEEEQQEALLKIEQALKDMLEKQRKISADTTALDKILEAARKARKQPDRADLRKAQELSQSEADLAEEAKRIITHLEQEGSTAVFPTVLKEIQADLKSLEQYLAKPDAGSVTQLVQNSVERSLEELIDALQKERARRKKESAGGGGGGGGGGAPPLVPPIAELKMLKQLQINLNNRTKVLDMARGNRAELTEAERDQIQAVSEKQKKVAVMANELKEKLAPPQQPPPAP